MDNGAWWQDAWAPLGVAAGVLLGRRTSDRKEKDAPICEACGGLEQKCPPGLPPAQFWLTVGAAGVATIVGYTTLQVEGRELRLWREQTSKNRFTEGDGKQLEILMQKELEASRAFSRRLCQDLKRVQLELDKIPSNDCQGP